MRSGRRRPLPARPGRSYRICSPFVGCRLRPRVLEHVVARWPPLRRGLACVAGVAPFARHRPSPSPLDISSPGQWQAFAAPGAQAVVHGRRPTTASGPSTKTLPIEDAPAGPVAHGKEGAPNIRPCRHICRWSAQWMFVRAHGEAPRVCNRGRQNLVVAKSDHTILKVETSGSVFLDQFKTKKNC